MFILTARAMMLGFRGKTMKTYYAYWIFSESSENGYQIIIHTSNVHIPPHWTFVSEIELPEIDTSEVKKAAVTSIDNEIADLRVQIQNKEEKKKQLLALDYKG